MSPFEVFWNSLFQPIHIGNQVFAFSIMTILGQFILPIGVYLLVAIFGFRWLGRFLAKSTWAEGRRDRIQRAVRLGLTIAGLVLLVVLGGQFVEVRVIKFFEDVFSIITRPIYHSGTTDISVMTLILAVPVFYLATLTGKAAKMAFERSKIVSLGLQDARRSTIASLIRYCVLVLVLVLGLSIIGLDVSSIGLFFGVLGVGIGIGLQQIVANFFSGLLLIVNRPIKEGDYVQVSGGNQSYRGRIVQVRMLNTLVQTGANESILVPNAQILNNVTHNFSAAVVRAVISLPVASDQDFDRVETALLEIAKRCPLAHAEAAPAFAIESIEGKSSTIQLSLAIADANQLEAAKAWLNREVLKKVRDRGLVLAS